MKLRWNNKNIPSLNVIIGKTAPYGSKVVLRHYHYGLGKKLVPGLVSLKIISCRYHACTTQLYLTWGYKIKYACNHPICGRIYGRKYFIIFGSQNNWIIMNFIDDGTYKVEYEHINRTIIDGHFTNISLINSK